MRTIFFIMIIMLYYNSLYASSVETQVEYVVMHGDTLSKIAIKYYGTYSKYNVLQLLKNKNKIDNINKIYPGQIIAVPFIEGVSIEKYFRKKKVSQEYERNAQMGRPEEGRIRRSFATDGRPEEARTRRSFVVEKGRPEEGRIKRNTTTDGRPEEGRIRWGRNPSSKVTKEELERELSMSSAYYLHPKMEDEIKELSGKNTFLVNSNAGTLPTIDIINRFIQMRFGNSANIIEKNDYKIRFIISGLKNEILKNSNKWERIQLDIYLLNRYKFLLYIDAFYALGLGGKEPSLSGYLDMEKNYFAELSYYAKRLRLEIEEYIQFYE